MSNYEKLVWYVMISVGWITHLAVTFIMTVMPGPKASLAVVGRSAWFAVGWTLALGFIWLLRVVYVAGKKARR